MRYLLDQDISVIEQMQVIKTILCCLLSTAVVVPLASEWIVLMCGIFLAEKNLLKQPTCPSCQRIKCRMEKSKQSCPCWNCMAENHVKGSFLVEIPFYSLGIRAAFLSLKVEKDQNKNKIDISRKKSKGKK